jgi:uncharacterized protein (UPF0332 family)
MVIKDLIDCEHSRVLKKSPPDPVIIRSEVDGSDYDLNSAKRDLQFNDFKWATIKAYYSMLHMSNAVARSRGLVTENHHCVYQYLSRLVDGKELELSYAAGFKGIYDYRIKADYGLKYSKNTAIDALEIAERFDKRMRALIK